MKKRFSLIGLLSCILILSVLCGCGSKEQSQNKDNTKSMDNNVTEMSITEKPESDSVFTKRFLEDFSDGYAWITLSDESRDNNRFVCINTKGEIQFILNERIPLDGAKYYNDIGRFKGGFAVVVDNNDIPHIIDTSGNVLSTGSGDGYDQVLAYGDGYFLVEKYISNLHESSYVYTVIDSSGNPIIKDWFISETQNTTFKYRGDNVFSYNCTLTWSGGWSYYDFECINVKTQNRFKLENVESFFQFDNKKTVLVGKHYDGHNQIIDSNGNVILSDLNEYSFNLDGVAGGYEPIAINNHMLCKKSNDKSLYWLDLNTGQISELYHCGNGISATVRGCNDEGILLNVTDDKKSNWIVLIDYSGNEQFAPFEAFDGEAKSLSCNRIIANVRGDKGDSYNVYDLKGNRISFEGTDTKLDKYEFNSNLIIVKTKNTKGEEYYNYMDINGKLLFSDSTTEL